MTSGLADSMQMRTWAAQESLLAHFMLRAAKGHTQLMLSCHAAPSELLG